jgi:hypothetical protein
MFFAQTPEWTGLGHAVIADLVAQFAQYGLTEAKLALVLVSPSSFGAEGFAHRGAVGHYPAGLTAPYHLIHALSAIEAGRMTPHSDLDRALRDMMLWPSDSAANYVIDWLTGTTGDTALDGAEYLDWASKRRRLGAFFWALGWPEWDGCRLAQKQSRDMLYGREARLAGDAGEGLNSLTPLCAARLLWEMFEGDLPLGRDMLRRAHLAMARDQASPDAVFLGYGLDGFLAGNLPEGVRIWSKSTQTGWTGDAKTSWVKHDMLRLVGQGMKPLHIVLMTQSRALAEAEGGLFPAMGRVIWDHAAPHLRLPSLAQ